jgi:membrane protein required for colicin V production
LFFSRGKKSCGKSDKDDFKIGGGWMFLFDLVVLVVFIFFVVRGLFSGMISQVISVGSYVLCWVASTRFSFLLAPVIPAQSPWNNIGAMIILFIVTMVLIRFAHSVINKLLAKFRLVKYDRILGLLLGGVKGLFLCMVITFFAAMLSTTSRQAVLESQSGKIIAQLIIMLAHFIPQESGKMLKTQIELFNEQVDGKFTNQDDSDLQLQSISFETILGNVQEIRDKIEDKIESNQKAASLIDGIRQWWNGNNDKTETSETNAQTETITESESESKTNPPTNTNNQNRTFAELPFQPITNNTETEKQLQSLTQDPATYSAQIFNSTQEIAGQISTDLDSDQLLIPQDRGSFRLPRSPIQPSEFHRSQSTTNSPAKLLSQ